MKPTGQNIYLSRNVVSPLYTPREIPTIPYLFVHCTNYEGRPWSLDPLAISVGTMPFDSMFQRHGENQNPLIPGQESYSWMCVLTPELQTKWRDRMVFDLETARPLYDGSGSYRPEIISQTLSELELSAAKKIASIGFVHGATMEEDLELASHTMVFKELPEGEATTHTCVYLGDMISPTVHSLQEHLIKAGNINQYLDMGNYLQNHGMAYEIARFGVSPQSKK